MHYYGSRLWKVVIIVLSYEMQMPHQWTLSGDVFHIQNPIRQLQAAPQSRDFVIFGCVTNGEKGVWLSVLFGWNDGNSFPSSGKNSSDRRRDVHHGSDWWLNLCLIWKQLCSSGGGGCEKMTKCCFPGTLVPQVRCRTVRIRRDEGWR